MASGVRIDLRVSIVCYSADEERLFRTLTHLIGACRMALDDQLVAGVSVALVDNGPGEEEREKIQRMILALSDGSPELMFCCVGSGRNIGFGAGHNLAFDLSPADFHLVLNPDVEMDQEALRNALLFLRENPECGLLSPRVEDEHGKNQYPCKRYPSVFDLFLRGFAPRWLQERFAKKMAAYEMRDVLCDRVLWDPPIVSGCFMLLRSSVVDRTKGFGPKFFLYFEDFDLSLRVAEEARIAYVPSVRIVHHGGGAARKGLRHIFIFVRSAFIFFNKHGWRWF